MSDFYDSNYSDEFKQRLQDARCKKKFSQQDFADRLEDNDRSRVANWESKKSTTIPKTQDIPNICKILDIDPNYLFGFSTITNENDKAISEQIHLSTDNIKLLRNDTSVSNFINYLMTTPKFHSLLNQLNHICVNGFFSESIETTFSTSAIQKLEKAFHRFSCEVFSIDRNEHTFVPYVKKVFPWNRKKQSIEDFVQSIVINEKYYKMLEMNPLYQEQTSDERYENLIYDFSKASIKYLERNQLAELAKYNVSNLFSEIVQDYVDITVNNFKNREK